MSAVLGADGPSPLPWVRPTARLISWPAVVGPLAAVTLLVRALRAGDLAAPPMLGIVALAGVAAAMALALDDPAHQLTAALPVGRRRRALHRLALAVPVAVGAWAVAAPVLLPELDRFDAVSLVSSMSSVAVAVAVVADRARPGAGAPLGAATPFALVATEVLVPSGDAGRSLLELWAAHPWPVAAAAATLAAIGLRG